MIIQIINPKNFIYEGQLMSNELMILSDKSLTIEVIERKVK